MKSESGIKKVGVALGGGGARGLAHALALQTIESCGIKPAVIAGTSMGAIIGALYAAGISGQELVARLEEHAIKDDDDLAEKLKKTGRAARWLKVIRPGLTGGGLIKTDRFLKELGESLRVTTFEELEIPLKIVATDFWTGEQVVISSGELLPAINASMAIPGIFSPVIIDGRVLVDGGLCNNLPYDILQPECDAVIAVDVAPRRDSSTDGRLPDVTGAIIGMFDLMVSKRVTEKLKNNPPDIYLNPGIRNVRVLDFHKVDEIMRQTYPVMGELKQKLMQISG